MRVAIFTNTYIPSVNGVALCVEAYRRGLLDRGHEVHVFAPCRPEYDTSQDPPDVFRFPGLPAPENWDYDVALPFSRPVMEKLLRVPYDIIHTQHPFWVGVWGAWFARWADVPLVSTAHSNYELYTSVLPLPDRVMRAYIRARVATYFNRCHAVTVPVQTAKDRLDALGVTAPIEFLPNPIYLEASIDPRPEMVRARHGIPQGAFLMGSICRLAPEKNLTVVLQAAGIAMKHLCDARFLVVGDGPDAKRLRDQVEGMGLSDRIIFAGRVPHEEIPHYQAALDILVTASISETQPLAYLEAMALGTPLVAVRAPGAQDMVTHGETGLLSDPDKGAAGLAAEIVAIAGDPVRRRRIAEAARKLVRRHELDAVIDRMLEIYEAATARSRAGRI